MMALRWLAAAWLLTIPSVVDGGQPSPLGQTQLQSPPVGESRFDQSLDNLERNRVITPAERRRLEGHPEAPVAPMEAQRLQNACSSGALSRQECESGVVTRSGPGRRSIQITWSGRDGEAFPTTLRRGADGRPLPLITVPVSALLGGRGFSLESVFAVSPRPASLAGNGDRNLLFPILGSAITTSEFGWRLHPVLGSWLMHAGKDLAAPEGTPVVAALSGTVTSSGLAGGYGIAVEIEHSAPKRRTLYGHLSEIYVKQGQTVRQGDVIGRVGSTGLSTGPHLHFELRRPEAGGWVAIDPGEMDLNPLTTQGSDAVAMLMGQLLDSLRSPVESRRAG